MKTTSYWRVAVCDWAKLLTKGPVESHLAAAQHKIINTLRISEKIIKAHPLKALCVQLMKPFSGRQWRGSVVIPPSEILKKGAVHIILPFKVMSSTNAGLGREDSGVVPSQHAVVSGSALHVDLLLSHHARLALSQRGEPGSVSTESFSGTDTGREKAL